jgi:hypothetical protein
MNRRSERVGIERRRAPRCFRDERDVLAVVNARQLLFGGESRFADITAFLTELRRDHLHFTSAARGTLRWPGGLRMIAISISDVTMVRL